jgi:hypothetical protein
MGYTHYWKKEKELNLDTWKKFIADCKVLYKNMPEHSESSGGEYTEEPLYLNGCWGYKYPRFNEKVLHFNGSSIHPSKRTYNVEVQEWSDDPKDLGHETFHISQKQNEYDGGFCKTARKPYDLMVQACLILFKYHFWNEVSISSDGDYDEWKVAQKFVGEFFPQVAMKFELLHDDFGITN